MARTFSLATLAVIGALLMAWLPTAQSFNFGRIVIHSPIVLRSPSAGPLEAPRHLSIVTAGARARLLVSHMLQRLTPAAFSQQERTDSRSPEPAAASSGGLPQPAATPRRAWPGLLPPAPEDAPSPPALAAGPVAPPPADTTQAEEQPATAPSPAPSAAPAPQVTPNPSGDPAKPAHPGAGGVSGGSGRGGRGRGRGAGGDLSGGPDD